MVQTYAIVKDNRILAVYETADGTFGASIAARNEGHIDGQLIEVPSGFRGAPGYDIREYNKEGLLRPLADRIADGLVIITNRETVDGEQIRKKTEYELIQDGIEPVPKGMRIIESDNGLRLEEMTVLEKVDAGQITVETGAIIMSANERARRNSLLSESDWTQVADTPLNQDERDAWAIYRQTLRDITNQQGFPWEITWPVRPDGVQA